VTGTAGGAPYRRLPGGISCIDAAYVAPGVACFYLVEGAGEYALVETGTAHSLPNLLTTLTDLGIARDQLRYVVPTHVHLDHAGAAGLYLREFPRAELLVHPRGARHLIDPGKLVASAIGVYGEESFRDLYGEIVPAPAERVRTLADGERFEVGGRSEAAALRRSVDEEMPEPTVCAELGGGRLQQRRRPRAAAPRAAPARARAGAGVRPPPWR